MAGLVLLRKAPRPLLSDGNFHCREMTAGVICRHRPLTSDDRRSQIGGLALADECLSMWRPIPGQTEGHSPLRIQVNE